MNREQFMRELRLKLARLPEEDIQAALTYYEEYFDEAGEENEAEIIKELGSASQVAKQIMGDHVLRSVEHKPIPPRKSLSTVWIVLLAIFASPIALPLAIAFVAIVFAVVVTVGALLLSGVAVVIALGVSVIVTLAAAFMTLFIHPATGLLFIGAAMVLGGIVLLLTMVMSIVIKKGIPALTAGIVRAFDRIRGGKKTC